uniref:Uncharacterized protein n=1 Tax=Lutzomyia longipalpis TaxID=7200 RepID=A0A1B0CDP9_LUTLO
MARGLLNNWKQPIFYGFDAKLSKDLLSEIADEFDKIGFDVVAIELLSKDQDNPNKIDIEEEGLIYVAGYIAAKRKFSESLGCPTAQNPPTSPWLANLSEGGLYSPTPQFLNEVKVMEELFKEQHPKNSLSKSPGILHRLLEKSNEKNLTCSYATQKLFFRTRIFIR